MFDAARFIDRAAPRETVPLQTAPSPTRALGRAKSLIAAVVGAVALGAIAVAPAVAYLEGRIWGSAVSDADHLMLAELLPSLASGTTVRDWTIPLANYTIPDWPLYGVALVVGRSPTMTIAVFMVLQTIAFGVSILAIARALDRPSAPLATVAAWSTVVALATTGTLPTAYLGAAYNHFGTLILTLLALAGTVRWLETRATAPLLATALVSALGVFSDRLFVVWFLVPATFGLLAVVAGRWLPLSSAVRWIGVHVVAAVAALPLPNVVYPTRTEYPVLFDLRTLPAGGLHYLRSAQATLEGNRLQSALVIIGAVLLLVQLVRRRTLLGQALPADGSAFLLAFLVGLVGSVSLALAAMSGGVPPHMRHYLILIVLPLALAPLITLAGAPPRSSRPLALAAIPTAFALFASTGALGGLPLDRSTVAIDCIETEASRFGSSRGIASYWDSRPIEVFSERRLDVAPFSPFLVEDETNTDMTEFASTYDFAVTSTVVPAWTIDHDRLTTIAGEPAHQAACGPWLVSNWGPSGLDLHPTDRIGGSIHFTGCDLSSQLAEADQNCVLGAGPNPPDGFLTFGPYVALEPGAYIVEADLRSEAPPSSSVGDWDLVMDSDTESPLDRGTIAGTGGEWTTITYHVDVPDGAGRRVVELRFDPQRGPLDVASLRVERTG